MKPRTRSRTKPDAPESIRPAWMMNCVIFAALLAAIGGCYVWLGVKKNERAAQINTTKREIDDLKRQLANTSVGIERKLDTRALGERVAAHADLELKPIPIGPRGGRLVKLPEPEIKNDSSNTANAAGARSLAATLHP